MYKNIKIIGMLLAVLAIVAFPKQAYADYTGIGSTAFDYVPGCTNTRLNTWNWPAAQSSVSYPGLDHEKDSYIVLKAHDTSTYTWTGHNSAPRNYYKLFVATYPNKLILSYDSGTSTAKVGWGATASVTKWTLNSEPNNDEQWGLEWTHAWNGYTPTGASVFSSSAPSNPTSLATTDYDCQAVGHNVIYDSSFTFNQFDANLSYGVGTTQACKVTDVGCLIGKAAHAIESAFQAVGMAIVEAIAWLFAPDGDTLHTMFTDFQTFITNKLGFIAYPFTFIGDVFNAFTSSSGWCTSTSCSKDFGNLFGHDFTVNLRQAQIVMPTLWTWFTAMLRGLVVVALLFAVRQKYRGITAK